MHNSSKLSIGKTVGLVHVLKTKTDLANSEDLSFISKSQNF